MVVLLYIGAVFRHWVASMSGIASLAVGSAIQWKWIQPETAGDPRVWWSIAAAFFVAAMFQAWHDEHRGRRHAEEMSAGPIVILGNVRDRDSINAEGTWRLTNSGAEAYNVTSLPIRNGRHYAVICPVDRLPTGDSVEIEFDIFRDGVAEGLGILTSLEPVFRSAVNDSALETMAAAATPVIPICLRYTDTQGREFETLCDIHWDCFSKDGHIVHKAVRRVLPISRLRTFLTRLARRVSGMRRLFDSSHDGKP